MKNREEIFLKIQQILGEMFELAADDIALDSLLSEDLDIDSIDAVDLMVRLREFTGKRINPEDFKNARTVNDVVDALYRLQMD